MDASDHSITVLCTCPLCTLYKKNMAKVQRWANDLYQKRKASYDEKREKQRVYHETILQKLRNKHALHINSFDAAILQTRNDIVHDDLESQYRDEMNVLNARLKQQVDDLVLLFKQDYTDRTSKLEGFQDEHADEVSLAQTNSWEAQYDNCSKDDIIANCETVATADTNEPSYTLCQKPAFGDDMRIALILDENSQLTVVCTKAALTD